VTATLPGRLEGAVPPAPAAGPSPAATASGTTAQASGTATGPSASGTTAVSREVAEHITTRLQGLLADLDELQLAAWRGEVWTSLGYTDWLDYLASEFARHTITALPSGLVSRLPPSIQRIAGARWRTVARFVRKEQERGLTADEFKYETGWDHGIVSSAFHQAENKGVIRRVEEFRGPKKYTVYKGVEFLPALAGEDA
jgi:hypothetical protein